MAPALSRLANHQFTIAHAMIVIAVLAVLLATVPAGLVVVLFAALIIPIVTDALSGA